VSVDYLQSATGVASLHFDGTAQVDVRDDSPWCCPAAYFAAHFLGGEFVGESVGEGWRVGSFSVPDGDRVQVRAFVTTTDGVFETLSSHHLMTWYSATALLEAALFAFVSMKPRQKVVTGSVITAIGPLTLGKPRATR
jgi:hypothetical protein